MSSLRLGVQVVEIRKNRWRYIAVMRKPDAVVVGYEKNKKQNPQYGNTA